MITDQDRRILRLWQANPNLSRRALASQLGMGQVTLNRRIEALRASGALKRRVAEVDWTAFGFAVQVFLRVTLDKTQPNAFDEFLNAAHAIDEITVIETLLGRVDVRMDIRARDLEHYQDIYVNKILALPHIADVESLMMVSEVERKGALPI